jgi:hypothetical protein
MDPWRADMIERKVIYGYHEELTAPKKEKEVEK